MRVISVDRLREKAKRTLPAPIFHYIDGAADDEWSKANNQSAFSRYCLNPHYLRDISEVDTRTTVLGAEMAMPLILSPTGMSRLFHVDKEYAVASAAARADLMYSLSTVSTVSIEDIGAHTTGPKMFQIYIHKDRGLTSELIARAREAGFTALCLTVDTPLAGNRERDHEWGFAMPPKLTLKSIASFLWHPRWGLDLARTRDLKLANLVDRPGRPIDQADGIMAYIDSQFDRTITWDHAARVIEEWGGPFAVKGVQSVADAKACVDIGASAIMISNHGGRQLDTTPAPVDCVRPIREAIGDSLELIVDGGVRRGTDLIKALALGANAVSFGRPYLYALAGGGEPLVTALLKKFKEEVERDLALVGCRSVFDLGRDHVSEARHHYS
ncbi:MAG: alpha-hydroxy acid oxidase [Pseudomonadota bacterium]